MYCSRCQQEKLASDFAKNQKWCKACKADHHRDYYKQNRQSFEIVNQRNRKRRREEHHRDKENQPCVRCGEFFPYYVMQYHHRDPGGKTNAVGNLISKQASRRTIEEEITKCDVICANCHAIVTHGPVV